MGMTRRTRMSTNEAQEKEAKQSLDVQESAKPPPPAKQPKAPTVETTSQSVSTMGMTRRTRMSTNEAQEKEAKQSLDVQESVKPLPPAKQPNAHTFEKTSPPVSPRGRRMRTSTNTALEKDAKQSLDVQESVKVLPPAKQLKAPTVATTSQLVSRTAMTRRTRTSTNEAQENAEQSWDVEDNARPLPPAKKKNVKPRPPDKQQKAQAILETSQSVSMTGMRIRTSTKNVALENDAQQSWDVDQNIKPPIPAKKQKACTVEKISQSVSRAMKKSTSMTRANSQKSKCPSRTAGTHGPTAAAQIPLVSPYHPSLPSLEVTSESDHTDDENPGDKDHRVHAAAGALNATESLLVSSDEEVSGDGSKRSEDTVKEDDTDSINLHDRSPAAPEAEDDQSHTSAGASLASPPLEGKSVQKAKESQTKASQTKASEEQEIAKEALPDIHEVKPMRVTRNRRSSSNEKPPHDQVGCGQQKDIQLVSGQDQQLQQNSSSKPVNTGEKDSALGSEPHTSNVHESIPVLEQRDSKSGGRTRSSKAELHVSFTDDPQQHPLSPSPDSEKRRYNTRGCKATPKLFVDLPTQKLTRRPRAGLAASQRNDTGDIILGQKTAPAAQETDGMARTLKKARVIIVVANESIQPPIELESLPARVDTSEMIAQDQRVARSRMTGERNDGEDVSLSSSESGRPTRMATRSRQKTESSDHEVAPAEGSWAGTVRIRVQGMEPIALEAIQVRGYGIPQRPERYSLRERKTPNYSEDFMYDGIEFETAASVPSTGTESAPVDKDHSAVTSTRPFVLCTSNRLSMLKLAQEYEEIDYRRKGVCFSLGSYSQSDEGARRAVQSLLNEMEELNAQHPVAPNEEALTAELQVHNRAMKLMSGRRSQEELVRNKEKEEAELLANRFVQQQWLNNKKRGKPVEDREWDEITNRPVHFDGAAVTRRTKRGAGTTVCPCDKSPLTCRLCHPPTDSGCLVPNKDMVPLVRRIDIDALDDDGGDDDGPGGNADGDEGEAKKRASRVSTRATKCLKFDPLKRRETTIKTAEIMYSMDFIEDYNAGFLL